MKHKTVNIPCKVEMIVLDHFEDPIQGWRRLGEPINHKEIPVRGFLVGADDKYYAIATIAEDGRSSTRMFIVKGAVKTISFPK